MDSPPEVLAGAEALETVAALPEVDYVMAAIVGAAGLMSSLAAARAGKRCCWPTRRRWWSPARS
jgi:1-deoxy-D-xylulose-5-phosphate reductoisomerase